MMDNGQPAGPPLLKGSDRWLALGEAAERLGVHPTTLRRWADNGDIPFMLTPGGHRRFAEQDVELLAVRQRSVTRANQMAAVWADRALQTTRQEIVVHREQPWLSAFDNGARAHNRRLGQQLLGLTMQFIGATEEEAAALLLQAEQLGQEYGELVFHAGLSLSDAVEAALFFRDLLAETALQLPENAPVRPDANVRLLRKINTLLNTVQLQIVEVYDASRPDILHRG